MIHTGLLQGVNKATIARLGITPEVLATYEDTIIQSGKGIDSLLTDAADARLALLNHRRQEGV